MSEPPGEPAEEREIVPEVGLLSDGPIGIDGTVAGLDARDRREVRKLLAIGVTPGSRIRLLRRFPSFVFQLGFSQFAVDRELAERIVVRWGA